MKKRVLALAVVTSLSVPSIAMAAINYDGTKLSSHYGPTYAPQTLEQVEASSKEDNRAVSLQDLPNAKAEQQKALERFEAERFGQYRVRLGIKVWYEDNEQDKRFF